MCGFLFQSYTYFMELIAFDKLEICYRLKKLYLNMHFQTAYFFDVSLHLSSSAWPVVSRVKCW